VAAGAAGWAAAPAAAAKAATTAASAARARATSGFAAMTPDVGPAPAGKNAGSSRPVPITGPPTLPSGSSSGSSGGGASSSSGNGIPRPLKLPDLTPSPEGSGADA
jgi:hypothetical protein